MAKEEKILIEATVLEALPNTQFRVQNKENKDHVILAYLAGKLKRFHIRVLENDSVTVEVSPYDLSRGRIIKRN